MVSGLRVEDRLDGQSNFGAWKERIISVLEEVEVWGIVEKTIVQPKQIPSKSPRVTIVQASKR